MQEPTGEVPTVQPQPENDYFSVEGVQAPAPVIEPIGPPPGVDAKDFPVVQPGTPATPMTEHGGYTHLTTPTEAKLAENARKMTELAGPSQTEQQ